MPILSNFPSGAGTSSGGLTLGAVSNVSIIEGSEKVYIKWTDPEALEVSGSTLAGFGGTILVRKAGSMPASRRDGTIIVDSTTQNAYADTYFCDSGLTNDTTYYYKFFTYTDSGSYNDLSENEYSATPALVMPGDVSSISVTNGGNGKLTVTWTDPAATVTEDGITLATWASTTVVVKAGSYPTSADDADAVYTLKETTRNQYSSSALTISGLTNGTTYYVQFFPATTDGAVNTNTTNRATGTPNRFTISTTPSQSGTLTYSGGSQSPTWSNYSTTELTIGGTTSATDAGTYTATFTPTSDYQWSDGTTSAVSVSWTIGRATLTTPSQSGSLTYSGSAQSPSWSNYSSSTSTIGGTTSATNAGTYTATFTPGSNYQWSDGTTTAKSVSWTIAQQTGTLTISPTSMTLNTTTKSSTIAVTTNSNGTISATSSSTSIATVSVSGTTITVTGVANGTATITVSVAASTNYTAPASKTCSVTVSFVSTTLNDNDWSTISSIASAGTGSNYWSVGDRKAVALSGTCSNLSMSGTYYAYIIGFNHNSSYEGTNRIHFQFGYTALSGGTQIAFVSGYSDDSDFYMNSSGSNSGGWKSSEMRTSILGTSTSSSGTFISVLPSALRSVLKTVTKYTDNTGGGSNTASYVTSTTDYMFLLSEYEVFGTRSYANSAEQNYQAQYAYYSAGNSKVRYQHSSTSSTVRWWLRSPYASLSGYFVSVHTGGSVSYNGADCSLGVAPGFCV